MRDCPEEEKETASIIVLAHSGSRLSTMQLPSLFIGSIQAYSPYDPQIEAQVPRRCPACGSGVRGKGVYVRQVWLPSVVWIGVRRVQCRGSGCGVTISLLPSFCVPFKRYGSTVIESCLDSVVSGGDSVRGWCGRVGVTDRSTAGSWVGQFGAQAGKLITSGCLRVGLGQPRGSKEPVRELWGCLRQWAGGEAVLRLVQPALCRAVPFLGLFRARL